MDIDFGCISLEHLKQQASLLDLDDLLSQENSHDHLGQNPSGQLTAHRPTDKSVEAIQAGDVRR